ncbi:protein LAZY 1-like [Aristolochia californica]|uniref:protein LAZY 1-like n=1 Tax=Aristolochia californica TaxID=171875 RepID=UPI0035D77832
MKLLGWMHRKFRQNSSTDPLKDFAIDRTPLEDQQQFAPKLSNFSKSGSRARQFRKSFTSLVGDIDGYDPEAEDDLFRGLLAIGTLGSDPTINDSPAADKQETHDVWIGDELPQETENPSEAVPDGAAKQTESAAPEGHGNGNWSAVCPLQRYLLGSPVEISATTAGKKEQRTSLGELFMKEEGRTEEKIKDSGNSGGGDRSGVHRMKKMLKRRTNHGSSRHGGDAATAAVSDAASGETKLRKFQILHIFHRKVHPENSASMGENDNTSKYNKMKKDIHCKGSDDDHNDRLLQDEQDIIIRPMQRPIKKENIWHCNYNSNLPFTLGDTESNGNREYWIKTDADYLVLEL